MQTEVLLLNDSSQGKAVKQLRELFPHVGVSVLAQALVVEAVTKINQVRLAQSQI